MSGQVPYDGNGAQSAPWWPSRYGAEDTLGSANELTPERLLAALSLPRSGVAISLARDLTPESPMFGDRIYYQRIQSGRTLLPAAAGRSQPTSFDEVVTTSMQVGTHLDGLGHVGIAGRHYNGVPYADLFTPTGLTQYSPSELPPWLCRGVCLDLVAVVGAEALTAGFVILPEHLEAAAEAQQSTVQPGDAVLIHTGWGSRWGTPEEYLGGEPGIGWEAAHWLTDRRVSVVGADSWGVECSPAEDPDRPFVVHQHLLAETGTYIVENLDTTELTASGRAEFLFLMTALRVPGATGSMVSPYAIL